MADPITHVAIMMEDGRIWSLPKPARHHHIIRAYFDSTGEVVGSDAVQGFLAYDIQFITREDAFALTGKGRGGKSYSEDLWDTPEAAQAMYLESSRPQAGGAERDQARIQALHEAKRVAEEIDQYAMATAGRPASAHEVCAALEALIDGEWPPK